MRLFELWMASAQLRSRRRAGFVSLVSLLSMLGVAVAVALLVVVLSVMNGFDQVVRERILSVVAHGSFHGSAGQLARWRELRDAALAHPKVESAAPYIEGQGVLSAKDAVAGAQLLGFDPREPAFRALDGLAGADARELLASGSWRIVLGSVLAERLGVGAGDEVLLMMAQGWSTPAGMAPRMRRLEVAGVFHAGMNDFDRSLAWVHYEDARRLFGLGSDASGLRVMLADPWQVESVLPEIAGERADQLFVRYWVWEHANFFYSIAMTKRVTLIILTILAAIAAFNIVSSLVMIVREKTPDIGILRTLGATPGSVMAVFVCHGGLAGILGVALGLAVGLPLAIWAGPLTSAVEQLLETTLVSPGYRLDEMPSRIVIPEVLIVCATALLLSLAATFYPALRAARTDPALATRLD
ncbi:MAG: lipoprotein-releasing ABC transporter permease subunit [Gammaproteobacteria bacterium]|nr:lipoprotein-releasing ABC transporter permease subunit [Gammaproteobacteria bacterium]